MLSVIYFMKHKRDFFQNFTVSFSNGECFVLDYPRRRIIRTTKFENFLTHNARIICRKYSNNEFKLIHFNAERIIEAGFLGAKMSKKVQKYRNMCMFKSNFWDIFLF